MKHWLFGIILMLPLHAFSLKDNDTIALLGNTVIERAQKYGTLETSLTLTSHKKSLKFRNLAWSGDTVFGHARSYFGPPSEGFNRLKADLTELKPQVIIISYGAVAAFDGKEGLPDFINGYERLLQMIKSSANPREIVIVSPPPAENKGAPLPDMSAHNERLALYAKALGNLAIKHSFTFVDLFTALGDPKGLTDNGLHFTEKGYEVLTENMIKSLGLTPPTDKQLQSAPGLKLKAAIIAKNKLFFHRWRPANETYLRLFRKHEQGQNAKELPMFDPIIAKKEQEIETLKEATLAVK